MELIPGLPDEVARECLIRIPYTAFGKSREVCKLWKEEIESETFHKLRKSGGTRRSYLILSQLEPSPVSKTGKRLVGPSYQLTIYEPETGTWQRLPAIPGFSDGLPLFCQIAVVGLNLVVIGGWNPATWSVSNSVFVYNFLCGSWRHGASMPGKERSFFACSSDYHHRVFVAGGHDSEKNALKSALVYDVIADEWISLPDMAAERDECKGVFSAGNFHVIGGYSTENQGRFNKTAESFRIDTWQWESTEQNMLENAICPRTCVAGDDGRIYMCRSGNLQVRIDDAKWNVISRLPADIRVISHLMTWQGKLVAIGSSGSGPQTMYTLDIFEDKKYTWTRLEMPEEYSGHVQAGCYMEL